jgi:hypothetical protein
MQITKADFDNAVKQTYGGETCIVAQTMMRNGIGVESGIHPMDFLSDKSPDADKARSVFDTHFWKPGDENKPELQKLRASLPITI